MKLKLTLVCDIDLDDAVAGAATPQQVADAAKEVAERAIKLVMRGAALGTGIRQAP